jgi:hypothetical protein
VLLATDEAVALRPGSFVPYLSTTAEKQQARQRVMEQAYGQVS